MQNTWWLSYEKQKNEDNCGKVTVKATIIIPVIRASLQLRGESLHWSGHNFSVAQSTQSAAQPSLTALPEESETSTESDTYWHFHRKTSKSLIYKVAPLFSLFRYSRNSKSRPTVTISLIFIFNRFSCGWGQKQRDQRLHKTDNKQRKR